MSKPIYPNLVEFQVTGDYALFTDPITRIGGEKCTYQVPTYEALKGIASSIYWKPSIVWFIDAVRVIEPIQTEVKGVRPIKYQHLPKEVANDLAYYTYLKKVCYQVRAHFEWNDNRPDLAGDRNENKHHQIALRMIQKGGRRDIFLGARECQGYVEPCVFGESAGHYDEIPELGFGLMYHGLTYPDESYSEETRGMLTANFWYPVMKQGVISFVRPESCPLHKSLRKMDMKQFGRTLENFFGLDEFKGVL